MGEQKPYDLGERTFQYAKRTRAFIKKLKRTLTNIDDLGQLNRASGSVGANYIEAEENLGDNDFYMRIKICRKEAKESVYWLQLLDMEQNLELITERDYLINEGTELRKIFGSVISKRGKK